MNHFYLVSHPKNLQQQNNRPKGLTFKEKQQRKQMAFLSELNFKEIYASPSKVAIQAITPLAKALRKDVVEIEALKSRKLPLVEEFSLEEMLSYLWHFPTKSFPEGESNVEVQRRVLNWIEELNQKSQGANFIISVDGEILALTLNYYNSQIDYFQGDWQNRFTVIKLSLSSTGVKFEELL